VGVDGPHRDGLSSGIEDFIDITETKHNEIPQTIFTQSIQLKQFHASPEIQRKSSAHSFAVVPFRRWAPDSHDLLGKSLGKCSYGKTIVGCNGRPRRH
jgi:hypothetical protein